jgi:hypothetical protein
MCLPGERFEAVVQPNARRRAFGCEIHSVSHGRIVKLLRLWRRYDNAQSDSPAVFYGMRDGRIVGQSQVAMEPNECVAGISFFRRHSDSSSAQSVP